MSNVIGLDIGGTKISGILYNGKKILKTITIGTPRSLSAFKVITRKVIEYLAKEEKDILLGVGIPGAVDSDGKVLYAPNLKFLVGFNFKEFLKISKIKKIKIENDSNCFALAEARLGQGKNLKNFIGITLGTGIGGGLISNGQIYTGVHGSAGEVGHMTADEKLTYERYFQKFRDSKNYKALGNLLGRLFADIYNILDVDTIILGGSVINSADQFIKFVKMELKDKILNKQIKPNIIISKLNNAGSIGAALLWVKS